MSPLPATADVVDADVAVAETHPTSAPAVGRAAALVRALAAPLLIAVVVQNAGNLILHAVLGRFLTADQYGALGHAALPDGPAHRPAQRAAGRRQQGRRRSARRHGQPSDAPSAPSCIVSARGGPRRLPHGAAPHRRCSTSTRAGRRTPARPVRRRVHRARRRARPAARPRPAPRHPRRRRHLRHQHRRPTRHRLRDPAAHWGRPAPSSRRSSASAWPWPTACSPCARPRPPALPLAGAASVAQRPRTWAGAHWPSAASSCSPRSTCSSPATSSAGRRPAATWRPPPSARPCWPCRRRPSPPPTHDWSASVAAPDGVPELRRTGIVVAGLAILAALVVAAFPQLVLDLLYGDSFDTQADVVRHPRDHRRA